MSLYRNPGPDPQTSNSGSRKLEGDRARLINTTGPSGYQRSASRFRSRTLLVYNLPYTQNILMLWPLKVCRLHCGNTLRSNRKCRRIESQISGNHEHVILNWVLFFLSDGLVFVGNQTSTLQYNDCVLLLRTTIIIIISECRARTSISVSGSLCCNQGIFRLQSRAQPNLCFVSDLTMIGNSKLQFGSQINFP